MSIYILSDNSQDVKKVMRRDIPAGYNGPTISVSDGNLKLRPTVGQYIDGIYSPSSAWLVFNTPAIVTCPFRTRGCGGSVKGESLYIIDPETGEKKLRPGSCYAYRAQLFRPSTVPARRGNLLASLSDNFVPMMTKIILGRAASMKKERLIVRIHESGDFYNQSYTDKWLQIAENCLQDPRVIFWTYTKSFPYFDGKKLPENFRLRASLWNDTPAEMREILDRNNWPLYTVYENELPAGYAECRCKDCAACGQCGDMSVKYIACKRH